MLFLPLFTVSGGDCSCQRGPRVTVQTGQGPVRSRHPELRSSVSSGLGYLCLSLPLQTDLSPPVFACKDCRERTLQTRRLEQQKFIFSLFWGLEVQGRGVGRFRFSRGLSPRLADAAARAVLTWPSSVHGAFLVPLPLLIRTPVLLDRGPTLRTSFNFNFPFKGPVTLRVSTSTYGFGGNAIQSVTP